MNKSKLHSLHSSYGAKFTNFGFNILANNFKTPKEEHNACRQKSVVFDVSHMKQLTIRSGQANIVDTFTCLDSKNLAINSVKYSLITAPNGGIEDDVLVTCRASNEFHIVINANSCDRIIDIIKQRAVGADISVENNHGTLAIQGPASSNIIQSFYPGVASVPFLNGFNANIKGIACYVSRSGYTGEDGFEIYVSLKHIDVVYKYLLSFNDVSPAGLAARDSLRLEAGLCLSGVDINNTITPVEAGLSWAVAKSRLTPIDGVIPIVGGEIIAKQLSEGASKQRVGFVTNERVMLREGTKLFNASHEEVAEITSGGFSYTNGTPIAMGYLNRAELDSSKFYAENRGKLFNITRCTLPFVKHRYYRV